VKWKRPRATAAAASATNGPGSRCQERSPARGDVALLALRCLLVFLVLEALYEKPEPFRVGAAGRLAIGIPGVVGRDSGGIAN